MQNAGNPQKVQHNYDYKHNIGVILLSISIERLKRNTQLEYVKFVTNRKNEAKRPGSAQNVR